MTNREFIELSKKEVKDLNESEAEEAQEAWRAGYNYARKIVRKYLATYDALYCIDELADFSSGELEEFEWNLE